MTDQGKAKLISHEGERLHAYQDSLGYWTIGIGHLIDVRKGGAISQQVSRLLLEDDIARATASARVNFPWFDGLDSVRQDAIVNLVFNLGINGMKSFKLMLAAIERHDWGLAAYELFNSQWARQVQKERRDDIQVAIELGKWD